MPVPAAATIPTDPRLTMLANPKPAPFIIAVPHPGPIISSSLSTALRLSSTSSSRLRLSLKRKVWMLFFMALATSSFANSPGTDITAMLGLPGGLRASSKLRYPTVWSAPPEGAAREKSIFLRASWPAVSDSASTAIIRSFAPSERGRVLINPASRSVFKFASVAIMAEALLILGEFVSSLLICMSFIESW